MAHRNRWFTWVCLLRMVDLSMAMLNNQMVIYIYNIYNIPKWSTSENFLVDLPYVGWLGVPNPPRANPRILASQLQAKKSCTTKRMVESLSRMGCLPLTGAGFRWPIHRICVDSSVDTLRIENGESMLIWWKRGDKYSYHRTIKAPSPNRWGITFWVCEVLSRTQLTALEASSRGARGKCHEVGRQLGGIGHRASVAPSHQAKFVTCAHCHSLCLQMFPVLCPLHVAKQSWPSRDHSCDFSLQNVNHGLISILRVLLSCDHTTCSREITWVVIAWKCMGRWSKSTVFEPQTWLLRVIHSP